MNEPISRRTMMASSLAAGAAIALMPRGIARGQSASNKIVLALAGARTGAPGGGGRGIELINNFAHVPGVEFKYVIDVNRKSATTAAGIVAKKMGNTPTVETDFRKALDDKDVDALLVATPDHWHAPMGILGLKAGKHVYVEKPCSHNPAEGEMIVAAQKKYQKLAQLGTQRRSQEMIQEMVKDVQGGTIGNVFLAQCFYSRRRTPIGFGKEMAVPADFNWDLWQGPAPRTAMRDNVQPYNWHWFWRWGTGEAGNNGIHFLDVARWALGVTFPTKVSSLGGRWHDVGIDDWETPDTQEIQLEFEGKKGISWFGRSSSSYGTPGYKASGVVFFGSKGTIDYDGSSSYVVYDLENKPVKKVGAGAKGATTKASDAKAADSGSGESHAVNFIEAIRGNGKLAAPIEEGHRSTLLAHLGNIAHRVGRGLKTDPTNGHIVGDDEAMKLWSREYESGWEPTV